MAMVALTPTALATTFSVGADERPGGERGGVLVALSKREMRGRKQGLWRRGSTILNGHDGEQSKEGAGMGRDGCGLTRWGLG
jgi:hypothetical protein